MKSLRDFNIDFMGVRREALALSAVLIIGSIAALAIRGLNFGLDFTGGTLVEVSYAEAVAPDEVRRQLVDAGFSNGVVQNFGSERDVLIRMPPQEGRDEATMGNAIHDELEKSHPGVELRRTEFVGPAVGEELRESGGLALLVSFAIVMIYIMFRFTGKFAVAAVLALIHDVIITLGAFAVFQWSFDLPGLAAVLAVIGYSINDTIVISDRIRENLRLIRRASVSETINISVNQTLDRTFGTAFSTLLVLVSLAWFGGDVVHGFALALIVGGIISGTYSSVYVAGNLLMVMGVTREDLVVPEKESEQKA